MVGVLAVVGRVEDDLGIGLGGDVSGRDGVGHGSQRERKRLSNHSALYRGGGI